MSRRAIIITIISLFGAIILGSIIYLVIPKATLLMSVAPDEVTVTINGQAHKVTTGDKMIVAPGELTITVSRDEFETYSQKLTIKNGETVEILQALTPKTDAAKDLLNSPKSQAVIQRITNNKMKAAADLLMKNYPILSVIPINDKFYTITTCASKKYPNDATKVAICVNLFDPEAKQSAIDAVKAKGFNLDDYETYFVDASYNSAYQQNGD